MDLVLSGDMKDRTYLEAVGLAADGDEDSLWADYCKVRKILDANDWDRQAHLLAWRLHGDSMIKDMVARMLMTEVAPEHRKELIASLAMNRTQAAFKGMQNVYRQSEDEDVKDLAKQFLVKGMVHRWKDHPVREFLIANNIIDAKPKPLVQVPAVGRNEVGPLKVTNVVKLKGDIVRGKSSAARCYSCHQFDGVGVDFGPNLKGWGENRSVEEIAIALINPSAGIAHGFDSHEVTLEPNWKERKSFWRINGIILSKAILLRLRVLEVLFRKYPVMKSILFSLPVIPLCYQPIQLWMSQSRMLPMWSPS